MLFIQCYNTFYLFSDTEYIVREHHKDFRKYDAVTDTFVTILNESDWVSSLYFVFTCIPLIVILTKVTQYLSGLIPVM